MWRAIVETALLFLTPFLAYTLFHAAQRRWPFVAELWHKRIVVALTIAGLLTAIGGMLALGLTERQQGAYVPAHVENGRLVPGRFQ
ncbi:DUF6111 family protein [Methylocystis parvus]|uniref:DUF6111 family protein n=1 Tax=Methylocystis parvus TaxID=134 RepID=UPI003C78F3D7